MDISDFYQTFFDEADELLAEMEKHLLAISLNALDKESLNSIFRAAHSIKGGAGTFGFSILQQTTHLLENLLDDARSGELVLNDNIINLFLESKDIMQEQLDAYKVAREPDLDRFQYICEALRQIALESKQASLAQLSPVAPQQKPASAEEEQLLITLSSLKEGEHDTLKEELGNLGKVSDMQIQANVLQLMLRTTVTADDILAILCFVLEPEQIVIVPAVASEKLSSVDTAKPDVQVPIDASNKAHRPEKQGTQTNARRQQTESGSIRVAVDKVDQIINQVGELIITQAMLSKISEALDPSLHDSLLNSIVQLERNARDLQESVMSVRMMPMEYVFSRFPRLVHDLAAKLNKDIELTLWGGSAELDKSLIERIIDPLTHLVRNSIDHGIESAEIRHASGKPEKGNLALSAKHHGGNIIIEVTDDGAGLNREKILARGREQGIPLGNNMSDEDVWMLIFMAGFSTAEEVTDVSGRGVGMDVVRRNIQDMGGHVTIRSEQGAGTTIRIILPLTLAILDGMSVRVGTEIYVLPLGAVMESLILSEASLRYMTGGEMMLQIREEFLPLIEVSQVFGGSCGGNNGTEGIAVIVQSAGNRYALRVDQLIGQHQVVVKSLEQNYRKVPGISAATILGDGGVALILDVDALTTLAKQQRAASAT